MSGPTGLGVPLSAARAPATVPLLDIQNLVVHLKSPQGIVHAVNDVTLSLESGRMLGVVGESGSGKSVLFRTVLGLIHPSAIAARSGSVFFDGRPVIESDESSLRRIRGREVAMIFQDPMTALNPVMPVWKQIALPLKRHKGLSTEEARSRAVNLLDRVGIADAKRRSTQYPVQMSGGMRQRVMIAIALSCEPRLLLADEPTTALDVTIQAGILTLLDELRRDLGLSVVLISHDLAVVANHVDDVAVMYAGQVVESGPVDIVLRRPRMPYTAALIATAPSMGDANAGRLLPTIPGAPPDPTSIAPGCSFVSRCPNSIERCLHDRPPLLPDNRPNEHGRSIRCWNPVEDLSYSTPALPRTVDIAVEQETGDGSALLEVRDLRVRYGVGRGSFEAVAGVNFDLHAGEVLAIVGESGSGKTTVARAVAQLPPPTSGNVRLDGQEGTHLKGRDLVRFRRRMAVIFQDPISSLNPLRTVRASITEAVRLMPERRDVNARVDELLEMVGLSEAIADRRPHQLSGGQAQRVCIARALALEPEILVCDEVVSALDVSVQAKIINLLKELQAAQQVAMVFISHDLAVVRTLADRVAVMHLGRICEIAKVDDLYERPAHPYTRALLAAVPAAGVEPRGTAHPLKGDLPSPLNPPSGCRFRTRCPRAQDFCAQEEPLLHIANAGQQVACHFPLEEYAGAE